MDQLMEKARGLLREWKGDSYVFGRGVLGEVGRLARRHGTRALLVSNTSYLRPVAEAVRSSLEAAGLELAGGDLVPDAGPNAPREDVYRIETYILHRRPDCLVAVGGGSTIDACKAAGVLASLGETESPEIEAYFGTGLVGAALAKTKRSLLPLVAVQTSASSGAHLTKYSNVTDPVAGQKKLIVDEAIVPPAALFDYDTTASMPPSVTVDGALDAIAHCFEVYAGSGPATRGLTGEIAGAAIALAAKYGPRVVERPDDMVAREAIGLATDLGGYAIMVGGTNGAHLTSFSLVDIAGHGTACGIMNPYYAVFFAPAIEEQLRRVGAVFREFGYLGAEPTTLSGRDLGLAVAGAMVAFGKAIGAPTTLGELRGFSPAHLDRALEAAKNPQLEMKLRNMPIPLDASKVDDYMGPILRAAVGGDFSLIRELP